MSNHIFPNSNAKRQLDELSRRLARFTVSSNNNNNSDDNNDNDIDNDNDNNNHASIASAAAALLKDPRQCYREERSETWCHDSNFVSGCDCEGCRNEIDPCANGCKNECVPYCKYYPPSGLETAEGATAYLGTVKYDELLKQWMGYRRSSGFRGGGSRSKK